MFEKNIMFYVLIFFLIVKYVFLNFFVAKIDNCFQTESHDLRSNNMINGQCKWQGQWIDFTIKKNRKKSQI